MLNILFDISSSQKEFIDKNNDALHSSLEALIQESKDDFIRSLYPEEPTVAHIQKLAFESVGNKFKVQFVDSHQGLKGDISAPDV